MANKLKTEISYKKNKGRSVNLGGYGKWGEKGSSGQPQREEKWGKGCYNDMVGRHKDERSAEEQLWTNG